MRSCILFIFVNVFSFYACEAQQKANAFTVVPLGIKGGSDESNLSCYAVAVSGTNEFICFDAGTIYSGIRRALEKGSFKGTQEEILRSQIKGYLISHPHLDHVAGLIINSPDDSKKPIYGLSYTLEIIAEKYFSWKSWANFGDKGELPALSKFRLQALAPGVITNVDNTPFTVRAFALSHSTTSQSTAFLVTHGEASVLYLGDTGSDITEKSTKLSELWSEIAPLIKRQQLHGIFIETSFSNNQPDNLLFGHFTPRWLMKELALLESRNGSGSLAGLPVIITHMKPSGDREATIKNELTAANDVKVKLIFPEQGLGFDL